MFSSQDIYLFGMSLFCPNSFADIWQPPFIGGNRDKIQQKIVKEKIKLPTYLSSEVHSLLKGVSCCLSIPCFHVFMHVSESTVW